MLDKHKITHGKHVLFPYFLQQGTQTAAISFKCHPVFVKNWTFRLYVSFCNKYIIKHHIFSTYDFMFMQHNSHSDRVKSLNLKTCKSINLQTTHIYMDNL